MQTLENFDSELYQSLVRLAAYNADWAAYFLLVNTCYEILKSVPDTQEACDEVNIQQLLIQALEQVGKTIYEVLPGGLEEFYHYMPKHRNI